MLRNRDLREALRIQREAVDLFPDDPVSHNGLAATLSQLRLHDEALEVYRETIQRFPLDLVSLNGLAETLRQLGVLDEALSLYRETMERFPNDLVSRDGFAEVLRQQGRFEEALSVYRHTVELFPADAAARSDFVQMLNDTGRFDEAIAVLQKAREENPHDPLVHVLLADTWVRKGALDEGVAAYREAVERFPTNPVARNGLAETLRRRAARQTGAADSKRTAEGSDYKYQVALSFAGEDRPIVGEIAKQLSARGVSVFYDEYEVAQLWGKDLSQHLATVYTEQAQHCIVFISENYAKKPWARHELKQIQARSIREEREYLLPVRLDDTVVPGVSDTLSFIDLRDQPIEAVVQAVLLKLSET